MSTFEQKQIEHYLPELTKLSHDARLDLIARLSESLKGETIEEKKPADFDKYYGAWESEETADELVEMIRNARTPNRDINLDD
ncbi:MAG: hypothetical protein LH606_05425 [Cytophagaceae bacterium]|nr:hypothetical protein [Cytophagaceae bacterium]